MPIPQPSSFLNWDTNEENILDIPSIVSDNGFAPGEAVPAEYLNQIIQTLDNWTQFLFQQVSSNGGFTTITTSQTLTTTFTTYFVNTAGGNITVTLPSSSGVPGQLWRIKNTGFGTANTVLVQLANAGNSLEGVTNGTVTLNPGASVILQSDGAGDYYELPDTTGGFGIAQQGLFLKASTYAINAATDDGKVFTCNSSSAAFNLTLPSPLVNMKFRVVDIEGTFGTNPVTIARHSTESIGGVASNYICNAPYGSWDFCCDGTNWQIIG